MQPPEGCTVERRTPRRSRPGTFFHVPFPHRFHGTGIPFLSAGWSRVRFRFRRKGIVATTRRCTSQRVACATPAAFWAAVMERRENHHVPHGNFFGSTPAFPRVFLCIGRINCFLASRREQNHPSRRRNAVDAMPSLPLSGSGWPAIPFGFGRTGVRTFTRFRFGFVSTLPRVATRHPLISGRRIRRAFSPRKESRGVHAPNCVPARHHSWWPRPARVMRDGMGPRLAPVSAWRQFRPRPRMRGFLPDRERHIHVSRPRRPATHRFCTGTTLAGSHAIPGRMAGWDAEHRGIAHGRFDPDHGGIAPAVSSCYREERPSRDHARWHDADSAPEIGRAHV